jgi:RNA polymerase sigma factor (sigma-70 family)
MKGNDTANEVFLAALRNGNNEAYAQLYRQYYPMVESIVLKNQGRKEDSRETFQETLLILYKKLRDDANFVLQAELGTFLYAIARNYWFSQLKKRKNYKEMSIEENAIVYENIPTSDVTEMEVEYEQQQLIIKDILEDFKAECKGIIMAAFYEKLSGAAIAQKFGYTEGYVKVKKFRCLEELRSRVLAQRAKTI